MLNVDVNNTASGDARKSLNLILEAMKMKTDFLRSVNVTSEEEMKKVFDSIFYARRHFEEVLKKAGVSKFSSALGYLKDEEMSYNERLSKFLATIGYNDEDIEDMAKEIMHYLYPEKFPLWTRWIWNNKKNTGSINYVLKEGLNLKSETEFLSSVDELKRVLEIFGLSSGNYYPTSVFLVYAYVRYLDYTTHLAVDKKAAGLIPTHLTTTALVMGLKPYIKVIKFAHT
ncbi:hypothetical protein GWK48_01315 [Metallosphaera tengchongensis]|uniref:Uncharacterized protein n=1 Tax=Metallosphaera tengchongensis TaxID=1532350 RepID=A0A6N0NSP9_9CREN|nr:hypothetical protein [Metallosphaera tengchongensis]QKQ99214.1 hypothetical protein GWK48_01315 [Metallosphaera tengchongensis]